VVIWVDIFKEKLGDGKMNVVGGWKRIIYVGVKMVAGDEFG